MQQVCTGAWEILFHYLGKDKLKNTQLWKSDWQKGIKPLASKKETQGIRRLRKDAEQADHYIYAVIKHCISLIVLLLYHFVEYPSQHQWDLRVLNLVISGSWMYSI